MKKISMLLLMTMSSFSLYAQNLYVLKFDSLESKLDLKNTSKYIGQTIYLPVSSFYKNSAISGFYKNSEGDILGPYRRHLTDANAYMGKSFVINEIYIKKRYNSYEEYWYNEQYFKLVNIESRDTLFYELPDSAHNDKFIFAFNGYLVKMNNLLKGKVVYTGLDEKDRMNVDSIYPVGGYDVKYWVRYNNGDSTEFNGYKKFIDESTFWKSEYIAWNKEQKLRNYYLKKYGDVRIGMRRSIVLKVCGEPDHINTTLTRYGTSEQFVYGTWRYIYIDNGVVTSVQDQD